MCDKKLERAGARSLRQIQHQQRFSQGRWSDTPIMNNVLTAVLRTVSVNTAGVHGYVCSFLTSDTVQPHQTCSH
jgi:hypothetical protein